MSGFDQNVSVSVTIGAPSVGQTGFGVPLWATDDVGVGFAPDVIRFYTSPDAVNADTDLTAGSRAALLQALAQTPRPDRVALGRVTGFGPLASADLDAIQAASADWYGLGIDDVSDADNTTASAFALANGKLFIAESADADIIGVGNGLAFDLNALSHIRTAVLYHAPSSPDYPVMSWFGKRLSINPDVRSVNWPYVNLPGVEVDVLTGAEVTNAETENANVYTTFKGLNVVGMGKLVNGNSIDLLVTQDWATARIQERAAQLLADLAANDQKPPYTDDGLQLMAQPVRDVIAQGILVGHFVEGTEVITVPRRVDALPADVAARIARISFSVELAGAIEKVVYTGVLVIAAP